MLHTLPLACIVNFDPDYAGIACAVDHQGIEEFASSRVGGSRRGIITTQAYVSVSLGINRLLFAPTSLLSAFCSLQFGPSSCCKHNQEPAICCSAPAVTNIGIHKKLWVSYSYICSSCYTLALHALQENFHCIMHSII